MKTLEKGLNMVALHSREVCLSLVWFGFVWIRWASNLVTPSLVSINTWSETRHLTAIAFCVDTSMLWLTACNYKIPKYHRAIIMRLLLFFFSSKIAQRNPEWAKLCLFALPALWAQEGSRNKWDSFLLSYQITICLWSCFATKQLYLAN